MAKTLSHAGIISPALIKQPTLQNARVVKLVDTADLKSAAFLNKGRTGSIPVPGTTFKAGKVQNLPAFSFSPMKTL